jgi:hypothetical protein
VPASLSGVFPVEESAGLLRNYRYAVERAMRILGGWIALTPELSAKLLLGRHVWDTAQHADALGKRLLELRSQAQVSEPSSAAFAAFMDEIEAPEAPNQTVERLVGVYRVLKPHLLGTYEWHLARTNLVYEPPTRRLLERCIEDERRHVSAGEAVLRHLSAGSALRGRAVAWQGRLVARLTAAGGVGGRGVPAPSSMPASGDPDAEEFIRLEQASRPPGAPADLEAALSVLGDSVVRGDWLAAAACLDPGASGADALGGAGIGRGFSGHQVVALARLGRQYLVKLRFDGPAASVVLLTRWVPGDLGWRAAALEVVRVETPAPA